MRFKKESYVHGMELLGKNEAAEVYASPAGLHAMGFFGKRNKPEFNYQFKTRGDLEAYAQKFLSEKAASKEAHEKYKNERKAAAKKAAVEFAKKLAPGAIVVTSWGYDQTNREFFQVVKVSGQKVTLREIAATTTETGFMSGNKVAHPNEFVGGEVNVIVRGDGLVIEGHYASMWDGKPAHCSWYA